MKRSRYSEEQIIGIFTEHDAGTKCVDLCRNYGMSEGTFYAWDLFASSRRNDGLLTFF